MHSTKNIFGQSNIEFTNIKGEDIPDSQYFQIPGTSISKLKLLDPDCGGSPEKYQSGFDFGFNASLAVGTAVHELILQPKEFTLSDYTNKPSAKLGLFCEYVVQYRKQGMKIYEALDKASVKANYYAGKFTEKRRKDAIKQGLEYYLKAIRGEFKDSDIVVDKKTYDTVLACIDSYNRNWDIQNIVKPGILEPKQYLNEIALFSTIKVTLPKGEVVEIPFKGKLDSVVIDHETKTIYLNDLKTTSSQIQYFMGYWSGDNFVNGSFQKLKYYFQMATYLIVLQKYCREVLGLTDYSYKANMFVLETTGEHKSANYPVSQGYINEGVKTMKELLVRLAFHIKYGFDKNIEDYENIPGTEGII